MTAAPRPDAGLPRTLSDDKGVGAIWLAVGMTLFMAFAGMSVDLGNWYLTRTEVQTATDAAALAGSALLPADEKAAGDEARRVAANHGFSSDLVVGMYTMLTREFTERAIYWSPAEVLRQATSESAEVIRMSGRLNRHGDFGEIREGWVADLVLINGEPLEDISVLRDPDDNLPLIMKAGEIVKNNL